VGLHSNNSKVFNSNVITNAPWILSRYGSFDDCVINKSLIYNSVFVNVAPKQLDDLDFKFVVIYSNVVRF
jgi:hypothetical protein